jgi:hypothetical protein
MDFGRIFKWIVIAAILFFAWKLLGPMLQKPVSSDTSEGGGSGDSSCVSAAARASETWGRGIGRFVNSTDSTEWAVFRGNVEAQIGAAESACDCTDQSCQTARAAMGDLRGLVGDLDDAFRSNSGAPTDIVQRQEAIDNQIDSAREQVRAGR